VTGICAKHPTQTGVSNVLLNMARVYKRETMITDDSAKELHDWATRGIQLSDTERAELEAWYARQDAEESAALAGAQPSQSLELLKVQVGEVMSQLLVTSQRIQAQAAENESLRREVAELKRQLAESLTAQQA
jgi:hypothetical protein